MLPAPDAPPARRTRRATRAAPRGELHAEIARTASHLRAVAAHLHTVARLATDPRADRLVLMLELDRIERLLRQSGDVLVHVLGPACRGAGHRGDDA